MCSFYLKWNFHHKNLFPLLVSKSLRCYCQRRNLQICHISFLGRTLHTLSKFLIHVFNKYSSSNYYVPQKLFDQSFSIFSPHNSVFITAYIFTEPLTMGTDYKTFSPWGLKVVWQGNYGICSILVLHILLLINKFCRVLLSKTCRTCLIKSDSGTQEMSMYIMRSAVYLKQLCYKTIVFFFPAWGLSFEGSLSLPA